MCVKISAKVLTCLHHQMRYFCGIVNYNNFITMADIFEKLVKHNGPIGQHRERAHGYFAFPKLEGEIGSRMIFRGKEKIVWSLNNYLGLANHPEIRKIDAEAAS